MATEAEVAAMVSAVQTIEEQLEIIDEQWKAKNKILKRLLEEDIPAAMAELGFTGLDTDEFKLTIKDKWAASIPQYKRNEVADYVENELDLGALVKRVLVQRFTPDEEQFFNEAEAQLKESQVPYETYRDVNTGSLKKAVKELIEAGESVDLEKVCVTKQQTANIKRQKK